MDSTSFWSFDIISIFFALSSSSFNPLTDSSVYTAKFNFSISFTNFSNFVISTTPLVVSTSFNNFVLRSAEVIALSLLLDVVTSPSFVSSFVLVDTIGCSPAIATAPAPKNTLHPITTDAIPTLNFLIE